MAELIEDAEHEAEDAAHLDAGGRGAAHSAAPAGHHPPAKGAGKHHDRTGLLVALSAAGVLVAFMTYRAMRSGGGNAAAAAGAPGSSATDPSNYPGAGSVAGAAGDGGASAGFATMLANLEAEVGQLQSSVSAIPTTPSSGSSGTTAKPSPHFTYKGGLHYLRNLANGHIYQVEADGSRVDLSSAQWAEIRGLDPQAVKHLTNYGKAPAKKPPAKKPPAKPPFHHG